MRSRPYQAHSLQQMTLGPGYVLELHDPNDKWRNVALDMGANC